MGEIEVTPVERFPFEHIDGIEAFLLSKISDTDFVVELGPGADPFIRANEYCDHIFREELDRDKFHQVDFSVEPLPYADKSVDFIYSNHVLEDLRNPQHLLNEIKRVSKGGFICTPSPMSEWVRGLEQGKPQRGLVHHCSFLWPHENTLYCLPKYTLVEHISFGDIENHFFDVMNSAVVRWNTHFYWHGDLSFKLLQHEIDFDLHTNYEETISNAIEQGLAASDSFQLIVAATVS